MTTRALRIVQVGTGVLSAEESSKGGIERYIYHLSENLVAIGNAVFVIDIGKQSGQAGFRRIKIPVLRLKKANDLTHAFRMIGYCLYTIFVIMKLQRDRQVDIVHTHTQFPLFFIILARKLHLLGKTKVVHTLHNPNMFANEKRWGVSFEYYGIRNSNLLVALSRSNLQRYLREYGQLSGQSVVINIGIDEANIGRIVRREKNAGPQVILCVSRISPRKNQKQLLKAIPFVTQSIGSVKVILAGPIDDEEYAQELADCVEEAGLAGVVSITGAVSPDTLYNLYSQADIFVLSSRWEGQPAVLIEAMCLGVPIAASDIGPVRETIARDDGHLIGCLFDPNSPESIAQAIIGVLSNEPLRDLMSREGRALCANYTWAKVAGHVASEYRGLITQPQL